MAARKTTTDTVVTNTPTVAMDNGDYVKGLLDRAVGIAAKVKATRLAVVTDMVAAMIDGHDTYRPLYDVVLADVRVAKGGSVTAKEFAGRLSERGKVLRNDPSYEFPIGDRDFATMLNWSGDADYHETAMEWYQARANVAKEELSFPRYVQFLKGYRDKDGNHYTEDGLLTERGQKLYDEANAVDDVATDPKWCSMDVELNLEGMSAVAKLAWLEAMAHDIKRARARIIKSLGDTATKVKRDAHSVVTTNTKQGIPIGGDRVSKAWAAVVQQQADAAQQPAPTA
ncbi:MAG TPA: hypothetical protein VFX15_03625 [Actinomycetes bacterium]|nr:hypothetical protein [Actinomycetes bacterium]